MPEASGEEAPRGSAAGTPGGPPRTPETVMAELEAFRQAIHRLGQILTHGDSTPIPLGRPVISAQQNDRDRAWKAQREHARRVLMRLLSLENQERLAKNAELIITGSAGTVFHVEPDEWSGNIRVYLPNGHLKEEWCVHPDLYDYKYDWYKPAEYAVAVQILALQTDEKKARSRANVEYYR